MSGTEIVPGAIERPRIAELLDRRWTHRFVVIVAGPGFGKSTAIAQAVARQHDPGRRDHHLDLDDACRSEGVLVERVAAALGIAPQATLDELLVAAGALDGDHCLILDDLHALEPDSDGSHAIRELARRLPASWHLVLASRIRPAVPLARARARHQVVDIDEHALRYDDTELAAIAAEHELDIDTFEGSGGWPALVSLTAQVGHRGALDFLVEEVIEGLDPKRVAVLGCAALAGSASPELLRDAVGFDVDPFEIAGRIPLVAVDDDGVLTPHDLWSNVIERQLGDDERRRMLTTIAEHRRRHGELRPAIAAASRAGGVAVLAEVVRDIGALGHVGLRIDEIDHWLAHAPDEFRSTPEGQLLTAISARAADPFSEHTKQLLVTCWQRFRETGIVGCEVVAMSELGFVLRSRGETDELPAVIRRFDELDAGGFEQARGLSAFARSVLAEQAGDLEGALAEFAAIRPGELSDGWMSLVESQRCRCLLLLGRPREAVEAARRSTALASPGYVGGWASQLIASWYTGVTPDLLDRFPVADEIEHASLVDQVWVGSWLGALQAMGGRLDAAARNIGAAEAAVRVDTQPELIAGLAWAKIVDAVADHDEERARRLLEEFTDDVELESPLGLRMASRFPAIADQLVDGPQRSALRTALSGRWQRDALAVSELLHRVRAGDASGDWPEPATVMTAVPLPWATELAARGVALGSTAATDIRDHLVSVAGAEAVERAAAVLPAELRPGNACSPASVASSVSPMVCVLGPVSVRPGVDGDGLRRRRVRELLVAIALDGPISREQLAVALWPDHDPVKVSANLRTNLAHLRRLADEHGAPLITETDRGWQLADGLDVDAAMFRRLAAQAAEAERAGATTTAVELLDRALDLVVDRPLADTATEWWFEQVAERLTVTVSHAAAHGAELAERLADHQRAVRFAETALRLDPFHEGAHRRRIAALAALGDRAGAAAAAADLRSQLDGFDLEPATVDQLREIGGP